MEKEYILKLSQFTFESVKVLLCPVMNSHFQSVILLYITCFSIVIVNALTYKQQFSALAGQDGTNLNSNYQSRTLHHILLTHL